MARRSQVRGRVQQRQEAGLRDLHLAEWEAIRWPVGERAAARPGDLQGRPRGREDWPVGRRQASCVAGRRGLRGADAGGQQAKGGGGAAGEAEDHTQEVGGADEAFRIE